MKAEQGWQAALGQLQMDMPKAVFDTWVRDTELLSYEDGDFVIGVRNAYARDWLEDRLTSRLNRSISGIMRRTCSVRFVVWQQPAEEMLLEEPLEEVESPSISFSAPLSSPQNNTLNPRYSFDAFVVGQSNRLAHAASMSVAEMPAQAYNPLFLWGGVGLGKTHLLHAIGNLACRSGLRVLYVSAEEFTNDLINAIRNQHTPAFREKYRQIDLLLVDDIQFIAGKESTQEEFFHTFNTLHGQDKQIVMTSDRPPRAMVTLEERLRSRFEWGLTVDIQPPDLETRLAILRSKSDRVGYKMPPEILEMIAKRVESNIRELEGALTRVAAFSQLRGMPITPQLVESALGDLMPRRKEVKTDDILQTVAEEFDVTVDRILGRDRSRIVALPRQIAMFILREEANISLPQIGEMLGGRDHTTVMYGCDKVSELMQTDDRLRRRVTELKERLYGVHSPNGKGY